LDCESSAVFVRATRVRALWAAFGIALMTTVAVGTADDARAATQSPTPAPSELFGVHPVQEGRTTLPGGHFNFALVPGQRISDAIVVENFSSHTLIFHVYGADLLTAIGGGFAPAQPSATMRAVGAWIVVSSPTLTITAHGQSTDGFTITVPVTVSPGQHLGAVVVAADIGATAQGTPIDARAALIAVVTVPGSVRASARLTPLSGSGAGSGRFGFGITLFNTGNVLLTYTASVTIDNAGGRDVAKLALTPTNAYVVPDGQVPLAALWKEPVPLAGTYRAQATVVVLANGVPVRTLTSQPFTVLFPSQLSPWLPVGLGLAILLVIVLGAWAARRRSVWQRRSAVRRPLSTRSTAG
jgi:hypothetical protein